MPRKNKIIIRTGTGAPSASDFVTGEPAFDSTAGSLYVKNAAGTMAQIAGGGGTISDEFVYDCGEYTAASSSSSSSSSLSSSSSSSAASLSSSSSSSRSSSSSSSSAVAAALLTIARSNGTSTFTGLGTTASPFTRNGGQDLYETDGLLRYSWTAGATATVTLVFDYSDDNGDGAMYQIRRTRSGNVTELTGFDGNNITRTISVIAGDVITFSATGAVGMQYFANVRVSAA